MTLMKFSAILSASFKISCGVFVVLLFITGCKKDNQNLPDITENGSNTFGFKLNGKTWVPNATCHAFSNPCAALTVDISPFHTTDTFPLMIAMSFEKEFSQRSNEVLEIQTRGILANAGSYIYSAGNIYDSLNVIYLDTRFRRFEKDFSKTGTFLVTKLDAAGGIMSGTFDFTLVDEQGDVATFSEGRFDLQFHVCKCY
jgi:hypothetical protein